MDVDRDIDRVIDDFDYFDRMFRELDKLNDENDLKENSVRNNITKFYLNRCDVLDHFDAEKVIQIFRFNRESIQFIVSLVDNRFKKHQKT